MNPILTGTSAKSKSATNGNETPNNEIKNSSTVQPPLQLHYLLPQKPLLDRLLTLLSRGTLQETPTTRGSRFKIIVMTIVTTNFRKAINSFKFCTNF